MQKALIPGTPILSPVVMGRYDFKTLRNEPLRYIEGVQESTAEVFQRRGAVTLCAYVFARAVPKHAVCPRDFPREDFVWFTGLAEVATLSKGCFQFVLREMIKPMDVQMVVQVSETWVVQAKPGSPEYAEYREWLRTHNNDLTGFRLNKEQVILSVETRWGERYFYENAIRRDVHGTPSLTRWEDRKAKNYWGNMMDVFAEVRG